MRTIFNEEEKKLLSNLQQIIKFGRNQIQGKKIDLEKVSPKKGMLFMTFGVVHNYTEAIYVLCEGIRPEPAIILLRSIFEAWINTFFLSSTKSEKRLALFYMEDARNKVALANGLLSFIKKYPSQENKDSLTTKSNLDNVRIENENIMRKIKKRYKLRRDDKWPTLLQRARDCDKKRPIKSRKGDFEYNYHILYRFFSPYAHLDARGLNNFLKQRMEGGYDLNIGQSADLIKQVLASAFAFYLSFLQYMKKKGFLPKNTKLKGFEEIIKQISKKK